MRVQSKGSLFTCGRGQIHTIEAVIATSIIFGAIFFALSVPSTQKGLSEFRTLQLKKYADDILEILSAENDTANTTLRMWIHDGLTKGWNDVGQTFYSKISLPLLQDLSIATRLEIYDANGQRIYCNGTLSCDVTPHSCASSFRIVAYYNVSSNRYELYEVRLVVCYV
jgi:hypothetical protein